MKLSCTWLYLQYVMLVVCPESEDVGSVNFKKKSIRKLGGVSLMGADNYF